MQFSIFLLTIVSGFIGTIGMTIVMYLHAKATNHNTKVVHVLGTMVTGNKEFDQNNNIKILATGSLAHVFVGVLFSFGYFLLWNWGVFDITWIDSIIVGALSGLLAIIGWKSYFAVYNRPPKLSLTHYFIALFISHIVFGLVTVNVFRIITDKPQFWYQLQEGIN